MEYIFEDIGNEDVLRNLLTDVEIVFHIGAAVGIGQSMYEVKRYVHINTYATAKLLDLIVNNENSVKKLIVASSMSILRRRCL